MKVSILYLEITNQCNFLCKHCQNNSSINDNSIISFNDVDEIVSYLSKYDLETINITGGEPTVHPDFTNILERLSEYDIKINILSNGYFIDRYINIIKKHRHKIFVQISLDGYDRDSFYKIRNNYKFNTILENITLLKNNGIDVHIKTTLTTDNLQEYKRFIDLSKELGCKLKFNYLNPVGRGKNINDLCLTYQDILEFDRDVTEPEERLSIQTIDEFFPKHCSVLESDSEIKVLKINSKGEIFPCIGFRKAEFSLGNYKKEGLFHLFENIKSLRSYISTMIASQDCDQCGCNDLCTKRCVLVCEYMKGVHS